LPDETIICCNDDTTLQLCWWPGNWLSNDWFILPVDEIWLLFPKVEDNNVAVLQLLLSLKLAVNENLHSTYFGVKWTLLFFVEELK